MAEEREEGRVEGKHTPVMRYPHETGRGGGGDPWKGGRYAGTGWP